MTNFNALNKSLKSSCLLIMAFCLCTWNVYAMNQEQFNQKLMNFYLKPNETDFVNLQNFAKNMNLPEEKKNKGTEILIGVFFARIADKYGWSIIESPYGKIANDALNGQSELAKYVNNPSQADPSKLDIWWGSYFATGEDKYLDHLFKYAGEPIPKKGVSDMLVIGAATWSFKSNCRQHDSIKAYVEKKQDMKHFSVDKMKFIHECLGLPEFIADDHTLNEEASVGWINKQGEPIQSTDRMRSVGGFGGSLLITPDIDWREKWATPSHVTPSFKEVDSIKVGEKITILTFFGNPKMDSAGHIDITCNLRLTRPDGSQAINKSGQPCATGKLQGKPQNVRMTQAFIYFIGEDTDPKGKWIIEVDLVDNNRGVTVPLKNGFTLM